ncbi:low molecular weight protein-tyrosine-phosphatase [Nocardioides sp. Soil805]|uniref:low molecular weight protein-tyrosine-phosphatase n=1 Tax=Nocardioides sp. Soil805 TaxID=1736416 RepID=UPI000703708F|nr:low molecular weight protein-tyrosine-phosphatase [Nocardioides sp. Soil805]KRF34758.1 protein tyrosine phosphatase [Nocardioides sp. Soil805]
MDRLPDQHTEGPYRIALVCLGNICRSPMAHVVLADHLDRAGLAAKVEVSSAGTGGWHVGRPMDARAATALIGEGYDPSGHRARQYDDGWLERHDLVLVMDRSNLADVGAHERVALFRDFDPVDRGGEVPDPYYGGDDGFGEVLAMVERTSAAIVDALQRRDRTGTGAR